MHSGTWEVWWNGKWLTSGTRQNNLRAPQCRRWAGAGVSQHLVASPSTLSLPRWHCHARLKICAHSHNTSWGGGEGVKFFVAFFLLFFIFFYKFCRILSSPTPQPLFLVTVRHASLPTVRRCGSSEPRSFAHFGLSVRNSRKVNRPRRVGTTYWLAAASPSAATRTYINTMSNDWQIMSLQGIKVLKFSWHQ